MNAIAMDMYGKALMSEVRDETISQIDRTIDGKMRDESSQLIKEKLSQFNSDQLETLKWLVPQIVDLSLHNLLTMIEQSEVVKIMVIDGKNNVDINQVSDGLAGELYTEDGWIARFSQERYVAI